MKTTLSLLLLFAFVCLYIGTAVPGARAKTSVPSKWDAVQLDLVRIYEEKAQSLEDVADFPSAEIAWLNVLFYQSQLLDPYHREIALTFKQLAGSLGKQGKYQDAQMYLRKAIEISDRFVYSDAMFKAGCFLDLAHLYEQAGSFEDAIDHFVKGMEIYKRRLGDRSLALGGMLNEYAELLELTGRNKEADHARSNAMNIFEGQQRVVMPLPVGAQRCDISSPSAPMLTFFLASACRIINSPFVDLPSDLKFAKSHKPAVSAGSWHSADWSLSSAKISGKTRVLVIDDQVKEMIYAVDFKTIDQIISELYEQFSNDGGGVGTGTYFWCIDEVGVEVFASPVSESYLRVMPECSVDKLANSPENQAAADL